MMADNKDNELRDWLARVSPEGLIASAGQYQSRLIWNYVSEYIDRVGVFHKDLFGISDIHVILDTLLMSMDLYQKGQRDTFIELPWTRKRILVRELIEKTGLINLIQ